MVKKRKRNRAQENAYNREYHRSNAQQISLRKKRYFLKNREVILAKRRAWYKKNKAKENKRAVAYRRGNINARIAFNLRIRINQALKYHYKTGSAIKDLGCTVSNLKLYLEARFKKGMTW